MRRFGNCSNRAASRRTCCACGGLTSFWKRFIGKTTRNGIGQVQRGRMAGSEIRPYISGLVISEEVGAAKPNPLMLEKGMELARVTDRRRALMLGDSLTSDMAAAGNAGVDACWFNPKGAANDRGVPIAYEIASLDEVDAILDGTEE